MDKNLSLAIGTMLHAGTYRITRVLGRGGFGITYLAHDGGLDEYVAIKEFFPGMFCSRDGNTCGMTVSGSAGDMVEGMKSKFLKEARRLAKLRVKGIVSVRAAFEENGTAYYVMDFIKGGNLNDLVKRSGPLPLDRAMRYIGQVAEALSAVHDRNINHLDIKPANIMLDSDSDEAILIDFGLAKQYDEKGAQTSSTPTGLSHGYAPFEQYHQNGVRQFSPQADVYSLAATLYYLLSGVVPPHATDLINKPLTFPDRIPERLHGVIARAMSQKVGDRPDTVAQFMDELRRAVAGGSAGARKSSPVNDEDKTVLKSDVTAKVVPPKKKSVVKRFFKYLAIIVVSLIILAGGLWYFKPRYQFVRRTEAPEYSMAIRYNGDIYYVTASEWAEVPELYRWEIKKLGLVVKTPEMAFIIEPEDLTNRRVTWFDAIARYSDKLPDKAQGEVIAKNKSGINNSFNAFYLSELYGEYWTSAEVSPDYLDAYCIQNGYLYLRQGDKTDMFYARGVAPVPGPAHEERPFTTGTVPVEDSDFDF